jgi:phage protein D
MSIGQPTLIVTAQGRSFSGPQAALAALRVELGLGGAHDAFTALLTPQSPLAELDAGTEVDLAVGYGDSTEAVLTGEVTRLERLTSGLRVEVLAATCVLSRKRAAQAYLGQTVADIVHDLLATAEVRAGEIQASLKLASYHVEERRTLWSHLLDLARLACCDLSAAADGSLQFRPARSGPTADHTLRHGADLIAWSVGPRAAAAAPAAIVPYGAASEAGAEKWHLLLREPDGGSPTGYTRVIETLRDRDGTRALEEGLRRSALRATQGGRLALVGNAALRPGEVIALSGVSGGVDGLLRILSVTHSLSAAGGFRTMLEVEGVAT